MSVKLNRPPEPEESQKNSNFNGKTIPYPEFEPGTSGLAVGRHNHCTIWVGVTSLSRDQYQIYFYFELNKKKPSRIRKKTLYQSRINDYGERTILKKLWLTF
jgi:hypothetical protein